MAYDYLNGLNGTSRIHDAARSNGATATAQPARGGLFTVESTPNVDGLELSMLSKSKAEKEDKTDVSFSTSEAGIQIGDGMVTLDISEDEVTLDTAGTDIELDTGVEAMVASAIGAAISFDDDSDSSNPFDSISYGDKSGIVRTLEDKVKASENQNDDTLEANNARAEENRAYSAIVDPNI